MVRDDAKLGKLLTDSKGKTLYVFSKDTKGVSNCTGSCLSNWPALVSTVKPTLAPGIPGTLDLMTRPEGTKQVTYNGLPLYYFAKDAAPGDTNGEGVGGLWKVAAPSAA